MKNTAYRLPKPENYIKYKTNFSASPLKLGIIGRLFLGPQRKMIRMKHFILLVVVCLSFYQLPAQVRKTAPLPSDLKVEAKTEVEPLTVSVFPNPTNGVINISLEGFEGKKTDLRIMNVIGNIVYREVVSDPSNHFVKSVDLNKLAKGLYYVKLDAADYSEVRKVILR
jgi:hypothetical protein